MLRKLGFLAIAIAPSLIGCGDDGVEPPTPTPDPTLAAVFPETGFAGRTTRVQITADNAAWTSPSVSFGDGVTVSNVEVVTPNAIFADVTVDAAAAFGARTVTVTDGEAVTLADAFTIESPLDLEITGTMAQGSVVQIVIKNKDIDAPFDTSSMGDGFFEPLVFVGVELTAPTGVDLTTNLIDVQDYSITTLATIDVTAMGGAFSVKSGLTMAEQVISPGATLEVAPRTAVALTSGMPAMGMVEAPLATALYEFTPGDGHLTNMGITAMNPDAGPGIILLGESGSFATDFLAFTPFLFEELPGKVYAIVWDNSGLSGYQYTLSAGSRMFTPVTEASQNDTAATAQTLMTLPAMVTSTLANDNDADWVKITATAADVGKKIYAATRPGDPRTDTIIEFFRGATGGEAFGEASSDVDYHEFHISPAIPAAGTYFIKVTASSFQTVNATRDGYDLAVWVE